MVLSGRTSLDEAWLSVAMLQGDRWILLEQSGPYPAVDGFVRIEIGGLAPDRRYAIALLSDDQQRHSAPGDYRTPPAADEDAIVRIGISSCLGNAEPSLPLLWSAAEAQLDAFAIVGDAIYTQASQLSGYRSAYETLIAKDSFRALAASTPLVLMWDDHEVADNWIVGPGGSGQISIDPAQAEVARIAFREALPQQIDADPTRMWRSLRFGQNLELFLLDCRGERSLDQMISEAQLSWVAQAVGSSTARFKVVVSGVHLTDHGARLSPGGNNNGVVDRWQNYPEQRRRLLEALEPVPGVVLATGDMHYGGIQQVGAAGDVGDGLWEIATGPIGSASFDIASWMARQGLDQYEVLLGEQNFAVLTADAHTLSVALIDPTGAIYAERIVAER